MNAESISFPVTAANGTIVPNHFADNRRIENAGGLKNNSQLFSNAPIDPQALEAAIEQMIQHRHRVAQTLGEY
ncbi:MAG: hypothetical protein PHF37_07325 [Phycisphaerae bacterium]|nr:hypothetical protein [Phycisphaerae bacterium]